jgi:HD superfamily phosphohydrolase
VLQAEEYPLLSNKLPDISVDRWDYFMRDGFTKGLLPKETIQLFLKSVKEKHGVFYFDDLSVASLFAVLFLNFCRLIWLDPTSHGSYFLLANALKLGVAKGYIAQEDFFLTDDIVMRKLRATQDKEIKSLLDRLEPGKEFHYAEKEKAEFYGVNKPRHVDPIVLVDGTYKRVSDLISGMKEYFEEFVNRYRYIGVIQEGI